MAEMSIQIAVFAVILVVALILLLLVYPRVLKIATETIKNFINKLACVICKATLFGFLCRC